MFSKSSIWDVWQGSEYAHDIDETLTVFFVKLHALNQKVYKKRSQHKCFPENSTKLRHPFSRYFWKAIISYPLIRTRMCAYLGVRNVSLLEQFYSRNVRFSKDFADVVNRWSHIWMILQNTTIFLISLIQIYEILVDSIMFSLTNKVYPYFSFFFYSRSSSIFFFLLHSDRGDTMKDVYYLSYPCHTFFSSLLLLLKSTYFFLVYCFNFLPVWIFRFMAKIKLTCLLTKFVQRATSKTNCYFNCYFN